MSDIGATAFQTQLVVTCGFCGSSNDVTWFCKTCAESMCILCKISHPSIHKNHTVVPHTNDVMRPKIAEQCQIHPEKEISTYCNDCQVPCCATFQVKSHQKHDISTIEEKYLSAENMLNDRVKELEKDVMPTLDKLVHKTKGERSEKRIQIDRVKEEVNTFRKELKQAVDKSCDELIDELDQIDIEFEHLIERIDVQQRKVHEIIKEINDIIQKGELSMIKYFPLSPTTLVPEECTHTTTSPVFTAGRDILTSIKENIGNIEWTNAISDSSRSPTAIFDRSIIDYNKVMSLKTKVDITSITTTGENTAWLMDCDSDTMCLYNVEGKVIGSVTIDGSNGIKDMVIRRSGDMIVACNDKTLRRVSVDGDVSTLINTSPFQPHGLCLNDREDVVVCMAHQGGRNHVAVHCPDTGKKLRDIRGMDCQCNKHITEPYRVVYNDKDICVVNGQYSTVVCVDERGDVRWVYEGKEARSANSFIPRGISLDKNKNFLVTDFNNDCVHNIDKEGRLIKVIPIQEQTGLVGPWGICIDDKSGYVWIGNPSKDVVVCRNL